MRFIGMRSIGGIWLNVIALTLVVTLAAPPMNSLFDFSARDSSGKEVQLSEYRTKVTLVLNVDPECGFAERDYSAIEDLHEKYHQQGLRILAFPCSQFKHQQFQLEQHGQETLNTLNRLAENHQATFPLFSQIHVKGPKIHPIFKFLTKLDGEEVQWNFEKFLVVDGQPIKRYPESVLELLPCS